MRTTHAHASRRRNPKPLDPTHTPTPWTAQETLPDPTQTSVPQSQGRNSQRNEYPTSASPAARSATRLRGLRPYLVAYVATVGTVLAIGGAVSAIAVVRDLAHILVPLDWHRAPYDPSAHDIATALSLWFHNARLALAPLAAAAAVQRHGGRLRRAGDVLFGVVLAVNVIPVAVDLGTWGSRLLPYIPNAPVELLGLVIGPVSWWLVTRGRIAVRSLWLIAALVVALLLIAACLETWTVP
jgi:hypothetical protein